MAKRNISITNERVLKAFDEAAKCNKGSRLIEEAILYYLDSIENEYVTVEQVKSIVLDCIGSNPMPITNRNYEVPCKSDIEDILNM